jgi:hypothetical protein
MRSAWLIVLLGLSGCKTPGGVVETAQVVSKMSTQLNAAVADYVTASNARRNADEMRLASEEEESQRRSAINADEFKILEISTNEDLRGLVGQWREPVETDQGPPLSAHARLAQQFGQNTYDQGPLTQVATLTGALAKQTNTKDQLMALGLFSKQVYDDLKTAQNTATK